MKKEKLVNFYQSRLLPLSLLSFGMLMRFFAIRQWPFGFDQVQIMQAVTNLAKGDLTLVGPRTGPAQMFTGPLIYYISTLFYFLRFNYFSLVATSLSIAVVTGLSIYFLVKKILGRDQALVALFFWASSLLFIKVDQVTWNPNLTLLASSLIFFPLLSFIKNKKINRLDYILVFLGGFLGYQAHFSGFLLAGLVLLAFLGSSYKKSILLTLATWSGLIVSLLPTIIFDYRHDWYNLNGLFQLGDKDRLLAWPTRFSFYKSLWTTLENFGGIVTANFNLSNYIAVLIGLVILVLSVLLFKQKLKSSKIFLLLWIFLVTAILAFYLGDKPPYYFYIQLPAMLTVYVLLTNSFRRYKQLLLGLAGIFMLLSFAHNLTSLFHEADLGLTQQLKVKRYISRVVGQRPINQITYFVPLSDEFGLKYLLSQIPKTETANEKIYVAYPGKAVFADKRIGQVYIWRQADVPDNKQLFFSDNFRILSPSSIGFYRDNYYFDLGQKYLVLDKNYPIGSLKVFKETDLIQSYPNLKNKVSELKLKSKRNKMSRWQKIGKSSYLFYYPRGNQFFLLEVNNVGFVPNEIIIF